MLIKFLEIYKQFFDTFLTDSWALVDDLHFEIDKHVNLSQLTLSTFWKSIILFKRIEDFRILIVVVINLQFNHEFLALLFLGGTQFIKLAPEVNYSTNIQLNLDCSFLVAKLEGIGYEIHQNLFVSFTISKNIVENALLLLVYDKLQTYFFLQSQKL